MPGPDQTGTASKLDAAERVASLLRALPLRLDPPAKAVDDPEGRGWIAGLDEARSLIEKLVGATAAQGTAFGRSWPYLRIADASGGCALLAPGVPVCVGRDETQGPDGVYWIEEIPSPRHPAQLALIREAGGASSVLLTLGDGPQKQAAPDLVWFGDGERFLLSGGRLEVEDLFARLVMPASAALLERLLVRQLRVDPKVLDGLTLRDPETSQAPTIEVRRSLRLVGGAPWRDPIAVIRTRAGVKGVEILEPFEPDAAAGGETGLVRLIHEDERSIELRLTRIGESWRANLHSGDWPITSLEMAEDAGRGDLVYRLALDPRVDPMAPGLRGRLAFDLTADLIAMERAG